MDASRFDRLARSLFTPPSRRRFLGGLVATLGLAAPGIPGMVEAKKKKLKKLDLNGFGCVDVGNACRGNDGNCCSGICQGNKPKKGKKDKSRCVAHNVETCQADQDVCKGLQTPCGPSGSCFRTTGKASFCGGGKDGCKVCKKDPECEAEFGLGAACIVCAECPDTGGTACISANI